MTGISEMLKEPGCREVPDKFVYFVKQCQQRRIESRLRIGKAEQL